jgi:hypothetical protein
MNEHTGAWEAGAPPYENYELHKVAAHSVWGNIKERDWRQYVTLISIAIEDTIPDPSNIETLDAVRLLVREVNALRKAVGLQSYSELTRQKESEEQQWEDQ